MVRFARLHCVCERSIQTVQLLANRGVLTMSGNVLWTSVFNKPDSQSQDLTRQRIVQEERCGRRPATTTPGPEYDRIVRGQSDTKLIDPWAPPPDAGRAKVQPPLVGYGGTVPMQRPEHTGKNRGEQNAAFIPHFGSQGYATMKHEAPAGGASALGTKPFAIPGTRTPPGIGIYDSLLIARAADPFTGKP